MGKYAKVEKLLSNYKMYKISIERKAVLMLTPIVSSYAVK